jgi:hypothetical protein
MAAISALLFIYFVSNFVLIRRPMSLSVAQSNDTVYSITKWVVVQMLCFSLGVFLYLTWYERVEIFGISNALILTWCVWLALIKVIYHVVVNLVVWFLYGISVKLRIRGTEQSLTSWDYKSDGLYFMSLGLSYVLGIAAMLFVYRDLINAFL